MTDYLFQEVPVYDRLGVNLMLARNARIDVLDTVLDVVSPGLKQSGQPVSYVTTDELGRATFTNTQGYARLRSQRGLEQVVYSPQYLDDIKQAPVIAQSAADSAAASANSAAASAALVGAPADSAIAAAVGGAGSSTRGAIDASWQRERGFDARKYGTLVGDGVADDQPTIQAAINAASTAGGGEVFLPKGIFKLGSTLSLPSGVRLCGHSRRTTTLKVAVINVPAVTMLGASAVSTVVQTGVSHLAISGPGKAAGGTGSGVFIKWASVDVCLDSLWITGWGLHGIESVDSYSMTFRQVLLDSNGGDGFNGTTNQNNLTFDRTISINNGGRGYSVTGGTTCLFLNADAESNVGAGFDLRYVFAPSLIGCHMEKNGTDATSPNIYLHYRTGLSEKTTAANIISCVIQGQSTTKRGLVIDGATRTNFQGNWFANHVTDHVQTTSNADRTWVGANSYTGTGTELTDGSASSVRMDYDATNLCARTDVLRLIPRSLNPAVLAQGQTWWSSTTDQFKARDASAIRTVFTGWQGTATLDFPSIAAGATAELTVTVTGAATGDTVSLAPPSTIAAGLMWSGYVSAANTVTVRLFNSTASAVDPVSAGWKVNVLRS
ncbi:MAG TPA: glycosyl hydrolase family 28-related protein [Phytomonospora sp.]